MKLPQQVKTRAPSAIAAGGFFALTLLVFGPSQIYLTNTAEFSYTYTDLLRYLVPAGLAAWLAVAAIVCLMPGQRAFQTALSVVLAVAFLLWLQGNVMVWDFGQLDGSRIDWKAKRLHALLDGAVWVAVLASAAVAARFLWRQARKASLGFIAVQALWMGVLAFQQPEPPSHQVYQATSEGRFDFSPDRNVIILCLDTFQTDVFAEILSEEPSAAEILDGFTYFRNALGGFATTKGSVPLFLTGHQYDNSIAFTEFLKGAYLSDTSIPKRLLEAGYDVHVFPFPNTLHQSPGTGSNFRKLPPGCVLWQKEIPRLYDVALFRYLPSPLKRLVYSEQKWMLQRLAQRLTDESRGDGGKADGPDPQEEHQLRLKSRDRDMRFIGCMSSQARLVAGRSAFKYYHLLGIHTPFTLGENLEIVEPQWDRQGFKRQAKGNIQIVRMFLDKLRQIGAYDQSLIVILADHGFPWPWPRIGIQPPRGLELDDSNPHNVPEHVRGSGLPLVLIKPFGAKGPLSTSDAPVWLGDLPVTIARAVGLEGAFPGVPMFEAQGLPDREREFRFYCLNDPLCDKSRLPTMTEYKVKGFSWSSASWRPTYRQFGREITYAPPKSYRLGEAIAFGLGGNAAQYQASGWAGPEKGFTWTVGNKATLSIPLDPPASDIMLTATVARCLRPASGDGQRIILLVNGQAVQEWQVEKRCRLQAAIARELLNGPELKIELELPDAVSPKQLGLGADSRVLAVGLEEMSLHEAGEP